MSVREGKEEEGKVYWSPLQSLEGEGVGASVDGEGLGGEEASDGEKGESEPVTSLPGEDGVGVWVIGGEGGFPTSSPSKAPSLS